MSSTPFRVFLSSTSADLAEHRQAIIDELNKPSSIYEVVAMEAFPAFDGDAVEVSFKELWASDVLLGVYARRYGFVPSNAQTSVTQMEYEEAKRRNMPRLVFKVQPDFAHALIDQYRDDLDAKGQKLNDFISNVVQPDRVWKEFTTPGDLRQKVVAALADWRYFFPSHYIPEQNTNDYVGRESLLDQIRTALHTNQTVALTGMGGMGKTFTAEKLISDLSQVFSGGVLAARLGTLKRGFSNVQKSTMVEWAAHHHPGRFVPPDQLQPAMLREWLADAPGRVLVFLDDVWHIEDARALMELIPAHTSLMMTSRRVDIVHALNTSARPIKLFQLDRLTEEEGVNLLRKQLGDNPETPSLRRIVALVGGLPMALELVAGRIASSDDVDLADQFPDDLEAKLSSGDLTNLSDPSSTDADHERYQSISAALALSYESLTERLKQRFRRFGVAAPDAPLPAPLIAALWQGIAGENLADEIERMKTLTRMSLLSETNDLFYQHSLIRLFAQRMLDDAGETLSLENQYADYVTYEITSRFVTLSPALWERDLQPYMLHVQYMGNFLVEHFHEMAQPELVRAQTFARNASTYLANRRELHFDRWLEMGVVASQNLDQPEQMVFFLNELGSSWFAQGETKAALKPWYNGLQLAREINDEKGQASINLNVGRFYILSDIYEAPKYIREAVQLFERLNDQTGHIEGLMLLADVYGDPDNSREERQRAFELLQKALEVAEAQSNVIGRAEVRMKMGRLYDWLDQREEALQVLAQAEADFKALGRRDFEAQTHLYQAATYTNLGKFEDAQTHLEEALALFKLVQERAGLATTLLQLGQIKLHRGLDAEALTDFAGVVPLYSQQHFLDEHQLEPTIAPQFFELQFDDVLKQMLVETSRARGAADVSRFQNDSEPVDDEGEDEAATGTMPDLIIQKLVTYTLRAKRGGDLTAWAAALDAFARALPKRPPYTSNEVQFVQALLDILHDQPINIAPDNPYANYIMGLHGRIQYRGKPLFPTDEVERIVGNTLAVMLNQHDQLKAWRYKLRSMLYQTKFWEDLDESGFIGSVLDTLDNQLSGLSPRNHYYAVYTKMINTLRDYIPLPLAKLVETTVAVCTVAPNQRASWREFIVEMRSETTDSNTTAFLEAVLQIIDGAKTHLPDDHSYYLALRDIQEQIKAGGPDYEPFSTEALQMYGGNTVAVLTTTPKAIDMWRDTLTGDLEEARMWGRSDDAEFLEVLLGMLDDRTPVLPPDNVYADVMQEIILTIQALPVTRPESTLLPPERVSEMADQTVESATIAPQMVDELRGELAEYHTRLAQRGSGWQTEIELVEALLAVLAGESVKLSPDNPYAEAVQEAVQKVERFRSTANYEANIPPHVFEGMLRTTLKTSSDMFGIGKKALEKELDFQSLMDSFTYNHDFMRTWNKWRDTLHELRDDAVKQGETWIYEKEILDTLIAIADQQEVRLSYNNPYRSHLLRVLEEEEYRAGMTTRSDMNLSALSMEPEAFIKDFTQEAMGNLVQDHLVTTIMAMTSQPEGREGWISWLKERIAQKEKEGKNLTEYREALVDVMEGRQPTLPEDHMYRPQLDQLLTGLENYQFWTWLADTTVQVLTQQPGLVAEWRARVNSTYEEAISSPQVVFAEFFGALLAMIDGKPVTPPGSDPFHHLIQQALDDLQAIRGKNK